MRRVGLNKNVDRLELVSVGTVGWGGNSGFHCLNLAVQMRPKRILLIGYDMRVDLGLHWHGAHVGLNNPTTNSVDRWRRVTDGAAEVIKAIGVDVINCSAVSALQNYRKLSLKEALRCSSV